MSGLKPSRVAAFFLFLAGALVWGCSRDKEKTNPGVSVQGNKKDQQVKAAAPFANLHKAFKDAIVAEPPIEVERPPDATVTGKNVAKMYEQIAGVDGKGGLWEQVRFATPEGKRIQYTATIKTDHGNIEIEFYPDEAPNHVRNFIALAKVGYYDGLAFDQILNTKYEDEAWKMLYAGCPLGTGEAGLGSIGYWLLPEINDKRTHEVGTIGALHGPALESAARKFYITLSKAPWLDGGYTIFGKITQGLEVAQKISQVPVEQGNNGFDRPREPVIMREVTVRSTVRDEAVVARTP